jgi:uncharacterized protein (UPF0147 family)
MELRTPDMFLAALLRQILEDLPSASLLRPSKIACLREGFWAGPIKCVNQRVGDAGRQGLSKAKRKEEYEERTKQAMAVLNEVSQDTTTPRNIRRAAKTAMDSLQAPGVSLGVRAANSISILDDISQDPNMPQYTRVKIWNAVSLLEAIKD